MKNFNDYPEFLNLKQLLDLTQWSRSKIDRDTKPGEIFADIKVTSMGPKKSLLFDKNKFHFILKKNSKGEQSSLENGGIYKPKIDPVKPTGHDKNGDQPEGIYKPTQDPKKLEGLDKNGNKGNQPNGPHKNAYGGGQPEGIYKPTNDPKKPDGSDKNGSGGGDHGQSL